MANIVVLGTGMIGSAVALDLAEKHKVTTIDVNKKALSDVQAKNSAVETLVYDLQQNEDYTDVLAPFDLVVCAVPGFFGFETLKKVLSAKKSVVDISFFPENPFDLNYLAEQNGVFAIVDCGVCPGMSNVILGYIDSQMDISNYECLVGGLPQKKTWPFNYKAPFSAVDVIEEYVRPARMVKNGEIVVRPALSDCELMEIQRIGTMEAFNTDGLRTLIHTMPHIPNMTEKTLRYPGHAEYIQVLAKSGFFSTDMMEVDGMAFRPIDVTARILKDNWKLKSSDEEFTVVRITIEGDKNGKKRRCIYRMLDNGCSETKTSSMARSTGYTATAIANYVLDNNQNAGVLAPEHIGVQSGAYEYIFDYLMERQVEYRVEEFTLE
ncbi:MAG: saccharopine dehydrogenase NADP-binding domain-containing protein [Gammaproteobacteria bacterium]|nr:saccharopine dehydrogenase NADP-binding domain-containing protein [Gammaproteobacteria bacterium]MDH5629414.1 saccharopine dehydrogenase NADP-binding domain-containing protein [Gammaproteobacteria bacterium]